MSALTPTDLATSLQEQLAARHARWNDLAGKAFENALHLLDIGVKATTDAMEESASIAQRMIGAGSPQDWLSLSVEEGRAHLERMVSLGGEVAGITSAMQAEFSRAVQAEFTDGCQHLSFYVDNISQGMPDDARSPYSIMRLAIEKAGSGYEQWAAMTRQAAEGVDLNLAMTGGPFSASRRANKRAKKRNGSE